ncbi:hypothetical protein BDB00DRAFT_880486 [Zychaea mexicana]|uniref:uncharacterized protein n=1 Tax=Zychaea mexicana TaxID=64656 RepID=UPI0022FF253C|nr:uncharacterized protein BDB00DRAFT_880486 [Zychaea mexicana]KAI9467711.1 hypothetical protein BDB00DRAFT_880486 [Zychaea mexicana]
MNKQRATEGEDPVKFALLRLESVKIGWFDNQKEIQILPRLDTPIRLMKTDLPRIVELAGEARKVAFLLPFALEYVFRTMGHHYLTTERDQFISKYERTFNACIEPNIEDFLKPENLYHTALHWISPGRTWRVLQALLESERLPDAFKIRAESAPSGTAIIATTVACMNAMDSKGITKAVEMASNTDYKDIKAYARKLKENPGKYHKAYFAYGMAALDPHEKLELETMKDKAIMFAPIAQAFIDVYMRTADMNRAMALKKHAMQNPMQFNDSKVLFKAWKRIGVQSISQAFAGSIDETTIITAEDKADNDNNNVA